MNGMSKFFFMKSCACFFYKLQFKNIFDGNTQNLLLNLSLYSYAAILGTFALGISPNQWRLLPQVAKINEIEIFKIVGLGR